MKRARDVREQLLGLMDRVEVELVSNPGDHDAVCGSATAAMCRPKNISCRYYSRDYSPPTCAPLGLLYTT